MRAQPAVAPMPPESEIKTVFKAMVKLQQTNATFGSRIVVRALLGWLDKSAVSPAVFKGANGFALTSRCCSAPALEHACRRLLSMHGTLAELERARSTDWAMSKELLMGRMLVDRLLAVGVTDETLRRLTDPWRTCKRAEWEEAFGVSLPKKRRWRPFDAPSPVSAMRKSVAATGGQVTGLSVKSILTLAQPTDTIGEGWCSPLGHFCQTTLHFAEVLTTEGVLALAQYLRSRQVALGSTRPIVEVGAGLGRLAYLLNATGLFGSGSAGVAGRVVATDPEPDDQCEPHNVRFPLEVLDAAASMRRYKPDIVLCAWMEFGSDFTPDLRRAGVAEYVLIGEAGRRAPPHQNDRGYRVLNGPDGQVQEMSHAAYSAKVGACCYSLTLPPEEHHPGYERVLLPEVSSELLHMHDAQDAEEGLVDAEGLLVAVSFRRRCA